jgi:hypothetical protein
MIYVRVMLTWLLPTLGLVAGGQYAFKPISLFPAEGVSALLAPSSQGKSGNRSDARAFEQSVRVQHRRLGTHFGPSGGPTLAILTEPQVLAWDRVSFVPIGSEAILRLAKSWQFQLRAASEPRAPSSVS